MPTYDFKCPECEAIDTVVRSFDEITDESKRPICEVCKIKMRRVYTVPTVRGCPTTK